MDSDLPREKGTFLQNRREVADGRKRLVGRRKRTKGFIISLANFLATTRREGRTVSLSSGQKVEEIII